MLELQQKTKESFRAVIQDAPEWLFNHDTAQFITDVMNALILASDILDARENFKKNRHYLEQLFLAVFEQGKENGDESL